MKAKDLKSLGTAEARENIKAAIEANDSEAYIDALTSWADCIQHGIIAEARGFVGADVQDATIMAQRGIRQLTSEEKDYYTKLIDAMKSNRPQDALSDLDVVMPKTVIDNVFDDLAQNHPLLNLISFTNTQSIGEIYMNTNPKQLATWGDLTSTITRELTSGFKKVTFSQNKASAWIPVANAMLDLGPTWLDRYVRTILAEALAVCLEDAIVNGDGKGKPLGMTRKVSGDTGGVFPLKTAVKVTDLDPTTYGALVAKMAVTPKGNPRVVNGLMMVVNPKDYYTKIMPATTVLDNGRYVNDVLPVPTTIVQSTEIAEGTAVIGMPSLYFAYVGSPTSGKLEYSDEYKFLEDQRVYRIKMYAGGEALDENAFVLLDISGITPLYDKVKVVGTVATKEQA